MTILVEFTVVMLMISTGMSLDPARFATNWRRLSAAAWGRLLAATFILPPLLALLLGEVLPIGRPAMAGLFLIAVAPGDRRRSRR